MRAGKFPFVILGGGPAGLAAAIGLVRLGAAPLVVGRKTTRIAKQRKIGESIAPRSWPVLQRLGIEGLVDSHRHLPSPGTISSWGHAGLVANDFIRHPPGIGWHLDRSRFEADLKAYAIESGVRFVETTGIRPDRNEAGEWVIHGGTNDFPIRADFVIDATGRSCVLIRREGIRRRVFDRLAAWYVIMTSSEPFADARALVEARPTGWWYSALLPDGALIVAKFCDPDALAGRDRSPDAFVEALEKTNFTHERVSSAGFRILMPPRVAAADSVVAESIHGMDWASCGDAAASYDPLSSHGITTALATGADVANAAFAAIAGDREPLKLYEDKVRRSFEHFLRARAEVYAQEVRWQEAPFWSVRRRLDFPDLTC